MVDSKVVSRLTAFVLAIACSSGTPAQPSDLVFKLEGLKSDVVSISSVSGGRVAESGMGLVIHSKSGKTIVATAAHVVGSRGIDQFLPVEKITIGNYLGSSFTAHLIGVVADPTIDLAFLQIDGAGDVGMLNPDIVADRASMSSTSVWIFGSYGDWSVKGGNGTLRFLDRGKFSVDGLAGVAGQSGAPLVSAAGVLGLYLGPGAGAGAAREIPLTEVETQAKKLNLPYSLARSQWVVRSVMVHLKRGDKFSNDASFKHLTTGQVYPIPGDYLVPTGPYALLYDMQVGACAPLSKSITDADPEISIVMNCRPSLVGTWRSDGMRVSFLPVNSVEYTATTIGASGDAAHMLELNLMSDGADGYQANGRSVLSGQNYQGIVKVSPTMRSMRIRLENVSTGAVVEEQLERK